MDLTSGWGDSAGPNTAVRRLVRLVFAPAWAVLALVAALSAVGYVPPVSAQYALLVGSALFLGLPHGAFDHLVVPRARGNEITSRSLIAVGGLYALLGGGYAVVWFFAPDVAFVGFLLVTWVHWGLGDLAAIVLVADRTHLVGRGRRFLTAAVRGGIPMVVPLVAAPVAYRTVSENVVSLFGTEPTLGWLFAPELRAALGVGFLCLTVAALVAGRTGVTDGATRSSWRLDAGETVLLWVFFAVVPPVLAIGLYFPLWHSARHLVRVALLDAPTTAALSEARDGPALERLARDGAPMTFGGLALFGILALALPAGVATVEGLAGAYLVLLAVLTVPHVVVVSRVDRLQRVW
ncbi:Brp/Blh family beta-carotene 15,15'-dioxygenase [Haloferax chudinovii]|uniref:Probable beta-carotene 15,15'-dioxygenase n=1 Tax=Haloferax chudinovii TaxID=1109010 RepID=A0ABD5XFI6_9EURY